MYRRCVLSKILFYVLNCLDGVNKLCFAFAEFFDILTESGIFSDYGDNTVSLSYKRRFLKII